MIHVISCNILGEAAAEDCVGLDTILGSIITFPPNLKPVGRLNKAFFICTCVSHVVLLKLEVKDEPRTSCTLKWSLSSFL